MKDAAPTTVQAIGLVCLAGLLFVVMNAMVKALIDDHHPLQLIWARYFFHVAFVVVLFPGKLAGVLRTGQTRVHLGRSVLLLGSTILNFLALTSLPLGEVAAITFTSPIMVAALAVAVLREQVGLVRWLAIGAGFGGALLIVQPSASGVSSGAVMALGCAACFAVYQISTRIVREAEPIVSLLYGGLVGMLAMSVVAPFVWQWPSLTDWLLFALIGVLGAAGHLLVIMALQRAEASRISPFTYLQLVWAMLASFLVFGDVPGMWTLAGALVIVASGLYVYRLDMRERAALEAARRRAGA
ncbi:DMT family transporter [Geminicoccaceae bacterium 1502E]|nr:DMT family transporter [Geminicoccaceae bacterium 1502E]